MAKALATGRAFVKVHGTIDEAVSINNQNVAILADSGAKLTRSAPGVILEVKGTSQVSIFDLELSGGLGATGVGISMPTGNTATVTLARVKLLNNAGGAVAASGGAVTVSQSTIANNAGGAIAASGGSLTVSQSTIAVNQGGGIAIAGVGAKFDITNNFIFRNGEPSTSAFGGLNLGVVTTVGSRLEFNTIVDNQAAINSGGVICNVATFTAPNNLIARNFLAGSPTTQTMGACTYPTSLVQNDLSGLAFIHSEPPGPFDYHLGQTAAAAIDQATTASAIDTDVDGDHRPFGAQKDIGADEVHP
jgi:hypothetical protein